MVRRKSSYKKGNICRATTKAKEAKIRKICGRFGTNSKKCRAIKREVC